MTSEHRIFRKDFSPSAYFVAEARLDFELDYDVTRVVHKMIIKRRDENAGDLILNGNFVELVKILVEGKELKKSDYKVGTEFEATALVIPKALLSVTGTTEVAVHNLTFPRKNLQLMGLYVSKGLLVTQCEPEGFRRITYSIDQPSSMAKYTVCLVGCKTTFPTLLSNGDCVETSDLGERHSATFVDPFPKPGHLFGIVAGKLIHETAEFTTMSGQKVNIYIMAEPEYEGQLGWALECAVKAFKWDEEKFGREYDLKTFRAVGVSDFNMGAMENKSLNIFNISAIVAKQDRTRDWYYKRVAHVVAHEYFHNWSGNRVSVQDWFQIQLKEGFTSFRETLFIEDLFGKGTSRVSTVQSLRARQFVEDAGPTSHSIRPESYVSIDNFYTPTIYLKGQEVIRLYHTLLGPEGFRKGCDFYFAKFDGMAVSCDDFRLAMAEANNRDLTQFERWYTERRTPTLKVVSHGWNADSNEYRFTIRQVLPEDANYGEPILPLHIPICTGFIGRASKTDVRKEVILELVDWQQDFVVPDVIESCVPSMLRGFSAPVILESYLTNEELQFLMTYDTDEFNMWESGQILIGDLIIQRTKAAMDGQYDAGAEFELPQFITEAVQQLLSGRIKDQGMAAQCLVMPSSLPSRCSGLNPYILWQVTKAVTMQIAKHFEADLMRVIQETKCDSGEEPKHDAASMGKRSLRNVCLGFIASLQKDREDIKDFIINEFKTAVCYNDKIVLAALVVSLEGRDTKSLLEELYVECKNLSEVVADDWFTVCAQCSRDDALQYIEDISATHPDFVGTKNPNRMRALVVAAASNSGAFHVPSGEGYKWMAKILIDWDAFNSPVASVVAKNLVGYSQYDESTQQKMKEACKMILESGHCSTQMQEIVG
eukprot:Gregarina_sp_Poly_1__3275@NODE_1937_length_3042_cov_246_365714_g1248_i0_p1_GENE_NODE_1937_length_3042_cov_246_365714_g1248_i0NODE_1937_length_3042_cov_246_365714_g1248_i0_p1_ORF_typecomplete_len895_score130_55DUF3458_C/PF17432_2/1_1e02DUF3458_C/PF17432_2/1_7e61Peptidase_M1/PF01433_20/4_1e53DUF3458/PF11940_8/2_3e18Peptidase_M1_N/PF17900_1/1_2e14Peptidase_M61/PF05299_12/0_027Peptidase_Mx1/PF15890_5/0_061_NODE_1937_length_3042_cov_246_365714_g1248_i0432685